MFGSIRGICKRFVATLSFLKWEENITHLVSGIRKVAHSCGYACESSSSRDVSNVSRSLERDTRKVFRRCDFSCEFATCTEPEVVKDQARITMVRMQDSDQYIFTLKGFFPLEHPCHRQTRSLRPSFSRCSLLMCSTRSPI